MLSSMGRPCRSRKQVALAVVLLAASDVAASWQTISAVPIADFYNVKRRFGISVRNPKIERLIDPCWLAGCAALSSFRVYPSRLTEGNDVDG
jgi:hypothetical protein